tara:strand:+ start:79 stop:453 length:375 start_codon:yes stop_codon:yes gene_type:complete
MRRISSIEEVTMVIVTRKDLKLSSGKLAAQASHAAVNCVLTGQKVSPNLVKKWMENGARKIVCEVQDLNELKMLYGKAREFDLVAELISDAGHTEIPSGTITVLGIGPNLRNEIDKITGDLKLL